MKNLRMLVALGCFVALSTHAATVSVSQESAPGAGDFNTNRLGTIQPFSTTETLAAFYAYATQQFTNTSAVTLTEDQSHLFLVDASDGLGLFVVHDDGASGGGNAETRVDLLGGDTASFKVSDDPSPSDTYAVDGVDVSDISTSGAVFAAQHSWINNFTDGYVIGSLDGNWTIDTQFTDFAPGATQTISNLCSWAAISSDGSGGQSETPLTLEEDRRVRLSIIPIPPAAWLFGFGLLGLISVARRKKSA